MSKERELLKAVYKGNIEKVKTIIDQGVEVNTTVEYLNVVGTSPLHWAAYLGYTDIVNLLLAKGAKVNLKDANGETPLHKAAASGRTNIVRLILKKGGIINEQSQLRETPLHKSATNSHCDTVFCLLENKAQANVKDINGDTPLHNAAGKNGHKDIILLLLKNDADINAKNNKKSTPLHIAAECNRPDILKLLLENGADIDQKNNDNNLPADLGNEEVKKELALYKTQKEYKWVIKTYLDVLDDKLEFSISLLEKMCDYVDNLYLFRFPYTIANIFRKLNQNDREKIDLVIAANLRKHAEKAIYSSEYVALYKLFLRSSMHKGIIDRKLKYELDNIAESAKIFADERFLELKSRVKKLEGEVQILQHNIQIIATSLNELKEAMRRKARRDMIFGVAKIALAFVGSQFVDLIAGMTDFSDMAESSFHIFGHSLQDIGQALIENKRIILNEAAQHVLKKIGLDPNDCLKTWQEASLILQAPTYENIPNNNSYLSKKAAVYKDANNLTFFSDTSSSNHSNLSILQSTNLHAQFTAWVKGAQLYGQFKISVNDGTVLIEYISSDTSNEDIYEILLTLNDYSRELSDLKEIIIEERDIENNKLLIIAKTKSEATKFNDLLEKKYMINITSTSMVPSF